MRCLWLADVLRDAGLPVVEVPGWQTRGRDLDIAYGVTVHDTVTTTGWTDQAVDDLLVNGRPDVPGPLSQLGLDRQGRYRVIASGRANHAGYSKPWGNSSIGIEVYCAGGLKDREEPWNDVQYQAVVAGTRAILDRLNLGPSGYYNPRVAGHKEVDTRGKIDPYRVDMDQLRRDVAQPDKEYPVDAMILVHPSTGTPDALVGLSGIFMRPDQKVALTCNVESLKEAKRLGKRVYTVGGPAGDLIRGEKELRGINRLDTLEQVLAQAAKGW